MNSLNPSNPSPTTFPQPANQLRTRARSATFETGPIVEYPQGSLSSAYLCVCVKTTYYRSITHKLLLYGVEDNVNHTRVILYLIKKVWFEDTVHRTPVIALSESG